MKRIFLIFLVGIIVLMMLFVSSCTKTTKTGDITTNSDQYNGKTVNISGYVGEPYGMHSPAAVLIRSMMVLGIYGW